LALLVSMGLTEHVACASECILLLPLFASSQSGVVVSLEPFDS
jgi:hypothetical protein